MNFEIFEPLADANQEQRTHSQRSKYAKRCVGQSAFSLIELLIALLVMSVMVAATVIELHPVIQQWRANNAMNQVMGQLRWAREASIAERRDVQITFNGNNQITLTRRDVPVGQTVLGSLVITGGMQFMLTPGMPDTPDGFGNAAAIEFAGVANGPAIMQFQSDGTLIDGAGNPINGTVFLGVPNLPAAARAITVLGATGRVRAFRGTGQGWIQ